ncbi:hypothetical protein GBF35_48775 [Nonomuraea phyllanthi]|uniref:hypothetical protein n=1 Tax=Nonomuraea phyllanthi TaxID=2219224 RepID=UPI00129353C7|nr:hypothetical protein [Nonomuraea phyllanthi]QFY13418.1 hypothetical protein GBF35_48775 [Nonomuraea phyllanthi]
MSESAVRLRGTLATAVRALQGARHLNVVELGAAGVTTFDVHRDASGTPCAATGLILPWRQLGTPLERRRIAQAAGGISDEAVVIVCSAPGEKLPELAASWLAEMRPGSVLARVSGQSVAGLLREVLTDEPLLQPYGLLGLTPDPLGGMPRPAAVTVFPAGAAPGATAEVVAQASGEVVFAVLSMTEGQPRPVAIRVADLPPGPQVIRLVLGGPGSVEFSSSVPFVQDDRGWAELVVGAWPLIGTQGGRVHLVVGLETCGHQDLVARRIELVRQVILESAGGGTECLVSLVPYATHSYDWEVPERPVHPRCWLAAPDRALTALDRLEAEPVYPDGYRDAAQVEDMLAEVVTRLSEGSPGRTVLLTVGDRPPHPPGRHTLLACRNRYDWNRQVTSLERAGVVFGAITESDHPIWGVLGGSSRAHTDGNSVTQLCADLGLATTGLDRIPFPMIEVAP